MGRSASTPSMPTSMRGAQHPTWSADHADPNHVDHSLEMFRTGHGAGGAYKFDGEVAASGAGDSKPVTDYELECVSSLGLSNPSSNRSSSPFLSPRRWVHTMSRARSTSPLVAGARSHTRQAEDALLVIPRSVPVCVCLCCVSVLCVCVVASQPLTHHPPTPTHRPTPSIAPRADAQRHRREPLGQGDEDRGAPHADDAKPQARAREGHEQALRHHGQGVWLE